MGSYKLVEIPPKSRRETGRTNERSTADVCDFGCKGKRGEAVDEDGENGVRGPKGKDPIKGSSCQSGRSGRRRLFPTAQHALSSNRGAIHSTITVRLLVTCFSASIFYKLNLAHCNLLVAVYCLPTACALPRRELTQTSRGLNTVSHCPHLARGGRKGRRLRGKIVTCLKPPAYPVVQAQNPLASSPLAQGKEFHRRYSKQKRSSLHGQQMPDSIILCPTASAEGASKGY